MTYPFDPDGELMKDKRYGIGACSEKYRLPMHAMISAEWLDDCTAYFGMTSA